MVQKSESQSSGQSWSLNILVDVLLVNWFFNDLSGAEWDISWRIKINWSLFQGSVSGSPSFDLSQLYLGGYFTLASFSGSTTLTILPNEGITLILMLLKLVNNYPSGATVFWNDMILIYDILFIYLLKLHLFSFKLKTINNCKTFKY